MIRFVAVLFALLNGLPQISTAQHPVVGPRHGGGFGPHGSPRLHLGPLPSVDRFTNPTLRLHPHLFPDINSLHPAMRQPGTTFGLYGATVGRYPRGSYVQSGYLLPNFFNYGPAVSYGPPITYAPSITIVLPQPGEPFEEPPPPARNVVTAANIAEIQVRVPVDAKVWFDGVESTLAGAERDFATAPLPAGLVTTYEIRARWTEAGREMEQTRRLPVRAGGRYVVDFTKLEMPEAR